MDCRDLNQITVLLLWILSIVLAIFPLDYGCTVALIRVHQEMEALHSQMDTQPLVTMGMLIYSNILGA